MPCRKVPFERVVYSLGIRFVGERTAQLLADAFPSMESLEAATDEDLIQVHEIGERVASSILQFFEREENRRLIERLSRAGVTMRGEARRRTVRGPFTGKSCVITGTIPGYPRARIRRILQQQGARITASVSKKTDVLIHGADPGSKLDRAGKLGVELVDAEKFRRLVEADGRQGEGA